MQAGNAGGAGRRSLQRQVLQRQVMQRQVMQRQVLQRRVLQRQVSQQQVSQQVVLQEVVLQQLLFGQLALWAAVQPIRTPCLQQLNAMHHNRKSEILLLQSIFVILMHKFCIQSVMKKLHY
jgi:hypothetical protein